MPAKPFHAQVTGHGQPRNQFLIISKEAISFEVLPGTRCLVQREARNDLVKTLTNTESKVFAKTHGLSTSAVHRIRQALGIADQYNVIQ